VLVVIDVSEEIIFFVYKKIICC